MFRVPEREEAQERHRRRERRREDDNTQAGGECGSIVFWSVDTIRLSLFLFFLVFLSFLFLYFPLEYQFENAISLFPVIKLQSQDSVLDSFVLFCDLGHAIIS